MGISRVVAIGALLLSAAGCVPPSVIPEPLVRQVDRSLSLTQLRQDPERYKGASVVLGGVVLGAKFLQEGTQLEVLQLPLDPSDRPAASYEYSEGRFLVVDPGSGDPAVLQHRFVTVVGEVLGAKTQKVDEFEYPFPVLSARFIHVWQGTGRYSSEPAYPYYYPYTYPYYYPYAPYYPYFFVDPFFWAPGFYYRGPAGGPAPGPAMRRFAPPPMGGAPPAAPPRAPAPGPGGGRRFN